MDTKAYLDRLNYQGSLSLTADTLRDLHLAHLMTVPFENLDIGIGRPIILDMDRIYDKIVRQRRGGFCYELNGLLGELLQAFGFQVEMLSSGVYEGDDRYGPDFDHMMLAVTLDQRWLLDVGFGDAFREPLLLDEPGEQVQEDRIYRYQDADGLRTLHRYSPDEGWNPLYRFTLQPRELSDYTAMCTYQQTSPESMFTQKRICSRATPDGQISLSDKNLIITSNGQRQEVPINSGDEFAFALKEHFGIVLPPFPRPD